MSNCIQYCRTYTVLQVILSLLHLKVKCFEIVILDSKGNGQDECIDFTIMCIFECKQFSSRNNALILNLGNFSYGKVNLVGIKLVKFENPQYLLKIK